MSLSSTLLREAEPDQIQTFVSHSQTPAIENARVTKEAAV